MVELLDEAVAAQPDGIIASLPDARAVQDPLGRAIGDGIPVIAINMPDRRPAAERIRYVSYVGPDDVEGGRLAAIRLLAEAGGSGSIVCVDHYETENASHAARRKGFARAVAEARREMKVVRVDGARRADAVMRMRRIVTAEHVAAICSLGPPGAFAVADALRTERLTHQIAHGTFDVGQEQIEALRDRSLLFVIDSQQYLQGYLGIALLQLYTDHGFALAGDVLTGPRVIDVPELPSIAHSVLEGIR
jgi:simple sugar transport system substrate-binding protein